MKSINIFIFAIVLIITPAFAGTPVEGPLPINEVYVPKGFDANDNVQIVITGYLPNLCHEAPQLEYKIEKNEISFRVTSLRYDSTNVFCPEKLTPFMKTVDLGKLPRGYYFIKVNTGTVYEETDELEVVKLSEGKIDEYQYPYIKSVEIIGNTNIIELKGYKPSSCYNYDKTFFISNHDDTFSVLPRMKRTSGFCPYKMVPFVVKTRVPNKLEKDRILLHVRSLDKKPINRVFDYRL